MRHVFTFLILLFTAQAALAEPERPRTELKPNLTILADENLMLPAARLARAYAKSSHTPLTFAVKNAQEAEEEIGQGLEAHILITANQELIKRLAEQGLTDVSSIRPIARTQLALVANETVSNALFSKHISFAALVNTTPQLPILVEAPETITGARAAALMKGYEFSGDLTRRAQEKPSPEEMLATLRATPSLALMLAADASIEPDITILSVLPETISPPVRYDLVVLASESMGDARLFASFLESPAAQKIFANFGLQPPGK